MQRLLTPAALVLLSACAAAVSDRPCPRVTEFTPALQLRAGAELETAPALQVMMDAMAIDRAFNRAICP
jgi:hypothetical protein